MSLRVELERAEGDAVIMRWRFTPPPPLRRVAGGVLPEARNEGEEFPARNGDGSLLLFAAWAKDEVLQERVLRLIVGSGGRPLSLAVRGKVLREHYDGAVRVIEEMEIEAVELVP